MSGIRRPLLLVALALAVLALLIQIGGLGLTRRTPSDAELRTVVETAFADELPSGPAREPRIRELIAQMRERQAGENPPGIAIPALGLLGGIVVLTLGLVAAGLLVPERFQGRVQGALTLIAAVLLAIAALGVLAAAIGRLVLMLTLLATPPFGTIAYFALFGFFNRGGAVAILSLLLAIQIGAAVALVVAQPRFLENRGLVLLLLTAFAGVVIVSFLLNLVPIPLVSITDAIGAIVVTILALIWLVVLAVGAVLSLSRLVRAPAG